MNLDDYEQPAIADEYAPRRDASKIAAHQHRARATDPEATSAPVPPRLPFAVSAGVVVLLTMAAITWQLAQPPARPLQLAPTIVPTIAPTDSARAFVTSSEKPPAARTATIAPTAAIPSTPVPTAAVLAAPEQPPQTGQGAQPVEWVAPPEPTTEPPTATPVWPTSAPVVIADFEKPDITGTCQFVGCLGQHGVDLARARACHALFWQYGEVAEDADIPDMDAIRACIWEGLYR